jgi:hypothetical protein
VSKNSKHWSNEKGPSSTTKIVQRNNSERFNTTSQCILIQIFLFVIVVPADLSQQAKSAAADCLTYSDSIDKKSVENLNLSTFCPLEKTNRF